MTTHIETSTVADGTVAHIRLNRPAKLNALTAQTYDELDAALDAIHGDDRLKAILLSGAGTSFCAGFDLSESATSADEEPVWDQWQGIERNRLILNKLWESPKPTVSAVHGYCLGGGFALANHTDIIVATENAVFGEPEILYSLMPSARLACFVPPRIATELLLVGENFSAITASEIGLINRVVKEDALLDTAMGIAAKLAARPPEIVAMAKRSLIYAHNLRGLAAIEESDWRSFLLSKSIDTEAKRRFHQTLASDGARAALHALREPATVADGEANR